jgi:hypothetical protein
MPPQVKCQPAMALRKSLRLGRESDQSGREEIGNNLQIGEKIVFKVLWLRHDDFN